MPSSGEMHYGPGTTTLDMWRHRALRAEAEEKRLIEAFSRTNQDVCQELGKALGAPWFKDDQINFPGTTEADGVCVGDHVAESLAKEAADRIKALEAMVLELVTECESYLDTEYPPVDRARYPLYERRYQRDMEIVKRAKKLIGE